MGVSGSGGCVVTAVQAVRQREQIRGRQVGVGCVWDLGCPTGDEGI